MMNYAIWTVKDDDEILVEVYNCIDIEVAHVEKTFLEKGYVILETAWNVFGSAFIKMSKIKEN